MTVVDVTIAGRPFALDAERVGRRMARELPEPLTEHFVVVAGRRFPPKQVIAVVTGLDRADFTTHQARRTLRRLGFVVDRRSAPGGGEGIGDGGGDGTGGDGIGEGPHRGREAAALAPFVGKWVAQRGLEILVAADTPGEVLSWLERHDQHADGMFRVPEDPLVSGAAPV